MKFEQAEYNAAEGGRFLSIVASPGAHDICTVVYPSERDFSDPSIKAVRNLQIDQNSVVLNLSYLEATWFSTLTEGDKVLDRFTPTPHYKEKDAKLWDALRGNPELVAKYCLADVDVVRAYYQWWEEPYDKFNDEHEDEVEPVQLVHGKAIEGDVSSYGEAWQMFDFSKRVGGFGHCGEGPGWIHYFFSKK